VISVSCKPNFRVWLKTGHWPSPILDAFRRDDVSQCHYSFTAFNSQTSLKLECSSQKTNCHMEPYLASICSPYEHVRLIIHDAKPVSVSLLPASIYEVQCSLSPMRFVRRWGSTEKGAWIWAERKFSPLVNSLVGCVVVQSSKRRRYLNSWTMSFTELIRHKEQKFKRRFLAIVQLDAQILFNVFIYL